AAHDAAVLHDCRTGEDRQRSASLLPTTVRFMPICTESALPSTVTTVLPFMYQPKLPVENCLTSASISWPLIETLSGSAFSTTWVSETGQGVWGGMTGASDQEPGPDATAERFAEVAGTAVASSQVRGSADQDGHGGVGGSRARGDG